MPNQSILVRVPATVGNFGGAMNCSALALEASLNVKVKPRAEGKDDDALKLMRSAAELEDSTDKHPVTPGAIVPAHELWGDLLLELHQPAQALAEYQTSLKASPARFNGLYGAARAAQLSGDRDKARSYYAQLMALADHADGARPEIAQARAFLAKM